MIRHESQPDTLEGARTPREAFESYYSKKGWKIVDDAPVDVNDPSPTVSEQVQLLESDPDALVEVLAPSSSLEDAAEADAKTTTKSRGGNRS